jgi:putative ABC transport system substrate-binding protein
VQRLQELGWTEGLNVRFEYHWASGDLDRIRANAAELVGMSPDIIVASSAPVLAALQQETRTIPIVFVSISDPVASGFVAKLAHPGGNTTGFTNSEHGVAGKWLELLKEIAPGVTRRW